MIGAGDWVGTLGLPEKQAWGGNVGGTFKVGDVVIHIVPAMHGSTPDGRPVGFVLEFAGRALPVSLRTLDAIHLASAVLWRDAEDPDLVMATHDRSLGSAARAFGLEVIGVS